LIYLISLHYLDKMTISTLNTLDLVLMSILYLSSPHTCGGNYYGNEIRLSICHTWFLKDTSRILGSIFMKLGMYIKYIRCVYRVRLLHAKIHAYLISLLDTDLSMVFERFDTTCIHTYLMGLFHGIAARQNMHI
jgi:hypothetical protein